MTEANLQDITDAFAAMRLSLKHNPKEWKANIVKQFTTNSGIDEFEQLAMLKAIVHNFVEKHDIRCEDQIYDNDDNIANIYDFVVDLIKVSGFKKGDEE